MKEIKDLKIIQKSKIKDLDKDALKIEIKSASKKMFELKMKKELNELKQTHLITALRKYIAVLRTTASVKGFNIA